jgi:hypothetical protein
MPKTAKTHQDKVAVVGCVQKNVENLPLVIGLE